MTSNNSSEVESTFQPYDRNNQQWQLLFNELCYEVFYKHPPGKKLLAHLENKYFRSPVAFPNRDPSWAFFNEGHNELIRSFTAGMQAFMMKASQPPQEVMTGLDTKKAQTKPIK